MCKYDSNYPGEIIQGKINNLFPLFIVSSQYSIYPIFKTYIIA